MALAYTPPGVNVEELFSPSVNPLLATSAQICLIGLAQGYQLDTAQVTFAIKAGAQTLNAPAGATFAKVSSTRTFQKVRDVVNPTAGTNGVYVEGTDFTATVSVDAKTITVTAVDASTLDNNGGVLAFTYRIVPDKYFQATRLDSLAGVEQRYGPGYDASGIVNPLSAAAAIAFENGAQSIVVQPLFGLVGTTRSQPAQADVNTMATFQTTLIGLRDVEDVNVLVPVFGSGLDKAAQQSILYAAQDHLRYMAAQGQLLVVIGAHDTLTATDLRETAGTLRTRGDTAAEATVLVSPSRFSRTVPNSGAKMVVGGQYMAAAIAGMIAARPVSTPLTRKQVAGFQTVEDARDKFAKDADAGAGLMVVEQKGSAIQVRHGLTVDNTATARRELSVVRAKHRMIESIRDTIDTQIIGSVPADGNAPFVVKNAVISVLEALRSRRDLVDYRGVQARTLTNDPTTVECRFSYLPSFPLNYVNVVFSLDLTGGSTAETTFNVATV